MWPSIKICLLTVGVWLALVVLMRLIGTEVLLFIFHARVQLLALHSHSVHLAAAFSFMNLANVVLLLAGLDDAVCRAVCPRFGIAFETFERFGTGGKEGSGGKNFHLSFLFLYLGIHDSCAERRSLDPFI